MLGLLLATEYNGMEQQILKGLLDYGLEGIVIASCFFYIIWKDKQHQKERDEARRSAEEFQAKITQAVTDLHVVVSNLNLVMTTFLQNKK